MTDDMFEQAYHGVQKALDYALGTDETAGAGGGIVADAMLLAQRYRELRSAVLAGEAGFRTVERLEDPERAEALLIRYERATEALPPVGGSIPIASPEPLGAPEGSAGRTRAAAELLPTVGRWPGPAPAGEVVPPDMRSRRQGGRGAIAAGGVVSVPPPEPLDAILNLVEEVALARVQAHAAANRDDGPRAQQHSNRAKACRLAIAIQIEAVHAAGVDEGRRQQAEEVERLQVLLDHAEQYARDLQDGSDGSERTEERTAILTEAYWKLRDHAAGLRSTEVYRKASERKEGTLGESPAFQRYRWLEATARGIEDGARDLAEMLGVDEHEIERPAVSGG